MTKLIITLGTQKTTLEVARILGFEVSETSDFTIDISYALTTNFEEIYILFSDKEAFEAGFAELTKAYEEYLAAQNKLHEECFTAHISKAPPTFNLPGTGWIELDEAFLVGELGHSGNFDLHNKSGTFTKIGGCSKSNYDKLVKAWKARKGA